MPFNFYDTHTLLMAVQQLTPAATFLRDRYFPTNDASDIFATDDVLVEFRDGSKKLAPFVAPRKGGVTVLRAGYNMERYTPPFVAPRRVLTLDELRKRGFGEALYSQLTPEQRQQTLILRDADELGELITNREEAMAAETMLTNGCVMKHIADDVDKADEMEIRFYSEASNPATYTPTAKWDATGGKILKDLEAMIRMLTKRGLRASDLVCSPDVADTIINDAAVQKLLDNRRIEIGNVEPELLPDGAAIVARLNVLGRIISVISYDLTYTDDEGNDKLYIPSGKCVLTAPGAGRTAYGAVSQVEQSMIQIIKGTFGYYNGRKVIPITEADGPQKFDDELEARLVKEGVAKYIGEPGETAEQPAPAPGDDADEPASTNTAADEAPEYNEDMKLDELKEVAARYGVDASAMRKKADVIAAIEAAKAEQPDDGADDEEPPQIGAADPV